MGKIIIIKIKIMKAIIAIIALSQAVKVQREPLLTWAPTEPAGHPVNYFVPDFGLSHEVLYTENNIRNAEKELGHEMTADFGANKNGDNPRGYTVPDFGLDHDILDSLGDLKLEEGIHGEWVIPEGAKASEI